MADENGCMLWHNRRWLDYAGVAPANLPNDSVGGPTTDGRYVALVHPEDRAGFQEKWRSSLKTGRPFETEFRCRRHDGVFRWFLGRALPIRDDAGKIIRWFGTNTDIHEQKITETALRRSNEDLQQFAYVASHDLQEPLRTVVSFSQMLSRQHASKLDETGLEYLGFVVEAALRMSDLVRDLLAA
jgi:PAS domain S-box-containing protein